MTERFQVADTQLDMVPAGLLHKWNQDRSMALSPANIQVTLGHLGVEMHMDTVIRWLEYYVGVVEGYANTIRPPGLGERLGADEKRQDIQGMESYVMAMDLATCFILAWKGLCGRNHHM